MFNLWYWYKRRTRYSYKPVILVTGCSSGIGMAIAELLHRYRSYRVIVTARATSLRHLHERFKEDDRFLIRALDVVSDQDREALISEINKNWGGVNVLVNCAGISYRAVLEHMTEADEFKQMNTNYFGPVALMRAVLPGMRAEGRGKIINVSSVSGMLAMPTMSSYTASKYALEGVSEALWYEMKPLGINVTLIQPGFVKSKSFRNVYYTEKSRAAEAKGADEPYGDYANMKPFIERLMNLSITRPHSIAKLVLKVIRTENPPLWIPATADAMFFCYYLRRFVPRRILLTILFAGLPKVRRWGKKYTNRRR